MARLKPLGLNHTNVVFSYETVSGCLSGIEDPLHPFAPPQLHVRPFGAAALAAAFFVLVLTLSHGAMAGDAGRHSGNQGRLEAEYVVSVAGIPIGRGNWIIEISDEVLFGRRERHDDGHHKVLYRRARHWRGARHFQRWPTGADELWRHS